MAQDEPSYLLDIVSRRSERIDVDYKRWLDRDDQLVRAKLARHVAALANNGGGYIVLGVEDNGSRSAVPAWDLSGYNNDWINAISAKYLWPAPQCEVRDVEDAAGLVKVVLVPSHGVVPVCAKANGPEKDGKVQGISKGVYYTREIGPKSIAISDPEAWRQVIHRCVINEREGLLASISRLFGASATPGATPEEPDVRELLDRAAGSWRTTTFAPRAVDPHEAFAAYAFQLFAESARPHSLSLSRLKDAVGAASERAEQATDLGWEMFERHIDGKEPAVDLWGEVDGLQQQITGNEDVVTPRLWRVSADGQGYEARMFQEDTGWLTSAVRSKRGAEAWREGAYFAPSLQAVRMLQFVTFVAELAKSFTEVTRIQMAVTMQGLEGRILKEVRIGAGFSLDRRSGVPGRTVKWSGAPEQLIGDGAYGVAAQLIGPIAILFDGFELGPQRVERYRQDIG